MSFRTLPNWIIWQIVDTAPKCCFHSGGSRHQTDRERTHCFWELSLTCPRLHSYSNLRLYGSLNAHGEFHDKGALQRGSRLLVRSLLGNPKLGNNLTNLHFDGEFKERDMSSSLFAQDELKLALGAMEGVCYFASMTECGSVTQGCSGVDEHSSTTRDSVLVGRLVSSRPDDHLAFQICEHWLVCVQEGASMPSTVSS